MTEHMIIADARKVDPVDFFRAVTGKPPISAEEKAERAERSHRMDQLNALERSEYARARREREEIVRDRIRNGHPEGETYEIYLERVNAPFARAAERIREQMVCPVAEEKALPNGAHRVAA